MLDPQQTVANLVLDHSECAAVFVRHRIDFCCRGNLSIEEAAKGRNVEVDQLLGELSRTIAERRGAEGEDPRTMTTPTLVAHIVSKHHTCLRKVIPFVQTLAAKVSRVHGEHDPRLRTLETAVEELAAALVPHLAEEEQRLFPALEGARVDPATVAAQLSSMVNEHLAVASMLERIRSVSGGFTVPDWACNSYRTLFSELEQLESDVFTHVHLENHVLRPRFVDA